MAWMMEIPLAIPSHMHTANLKLTHKLYLDDRPTTNRTHARIPPVAWMKCLPNTNVLIVEAVEAVCVRLGGQ